MKNLFNPTKPIQKYSGSILALCAFTAASCSFALVGSASAQTISHSGELNIPYGRTYRDENVPYNPSTRSANGNRLIVNGRILPGDGSTLPGTLGGGYFGNQAGAGAIGNQLNVVTVGNWNTVIIDSTQINNGNQTVNQAGAFNGSDEHNNPPIADDPNSVELNGEINLND